MEMTAPAFPEKASSQDKMACYKRAHWVVNMPGAVYLRPAGTSKDDVRRIPYIGGVTDFISPEGHGILGRLDDGITEPPENWATKRQWSLDLMAMLCESGKKPPELRSYPVRPAVPIVGRSRSSGRSSPSYHFLVTFLLTLSRRPMRTAPLPLSRTLTTTGTQAPSRTESVPQKLLFHSQSLSK